MLRHKFKLACQTFLFYVKITQVCWVWSHSYVVSVVFNKMLTSLWSENIWVTPTFDIWLIGAPIPCLFLLYNDCFATHSPSVYNVWFSTCLPSPNPCASDKIFWLLYFLALSCSSEAVTNGTRWFDFTEICFNWGFLFSRRPLHWVSAHKRTEPAPLYQWNGICWSSSRNTCVLKLTFNGWMIVKQSSTNCFCVEDLVTSL